MKFGLFSLFDFFRDRQNEVRYYQDTLDLIIRAEQLGFDSVWLGEEHFYTIGICPSPQIFLTAAARETSRIRLGTSISLLPFENPLRKAEDFAMLDILSNGRLDFGVGRGSITKHFEGFRVPSAESRDRFEEALTIIRRAWAQDPVEYTGRFWSVPPLSLSPKPVQRPHPPIYRGVVSMTGLEGAGRTGDHLLLVPWLTAPHPAVRKSVTRYRELLKEHGHGPKRATWVFWLFIDRDHDVAVREGRDITRAYTTLFARILIPELLASRSEMQTNGAPEDLFQQFLDFAQAMPDELEQRAVVGTPADCRRRLRELDDEFDLDQVAFYFHAGGRDPQRARDGLELFAHEVMPEFA